MNKKKWKWRSSLVQCSDFSEERLPVGLRHPEGQSSEHTKILADGRKLFLCKCLAAHCSFFRICHPTEALVLKNIFKKLLISIGEGFYSEKEGIVVKFPFLVTAYFLIP